MAREIDGLDAVAELVARYAWDAEIAYRAATDAKNPIAVYFQGKRVGFEQLLKALGLEVKYPKGMTAANVRNPRVNRVGVHLKHRPSSALEAAS